MKKEKAIQDKNFIRFQKIYPDCNVIEVKEHVYLKMYKILDNVEKNYNECLKVLLKYGHQFFFKGDETYIIIKVEADVVDDAVMEFGTLVFECSEMLEGFDLEEVEIKDWLEKVCELSQIKNEIKIEKGIRQQIQPWNRKTRDEYIEIDGKKSRTVLLTNYPSKLFSGLITEIMQLSDEITGSLFVKGVNVEHCLEGADGYFKRYLEEIKEKEKQIYNTCMFLNLTDEVYEKVEKMASKYLVGINTLEHQQNQAFLSVLPLGINYVNYNKGLVEDSVIGLLNLSWMKKVCCGVRYGKSILSEKDIYYNRLIENASGFYLGKNSRKRVEREIEQIKKIAPDKKIEIIYMFGDGEKVDVLGKDLVMNRELLKAFYYLVFSINGILPRQYEMVLDKVIEKVTDYDSFVSALLNEDSGIGNKLNTEEYREMLTGGICLSSTYKESLIQMMAKIAQSEADVIYVMDGDKIAKITGNQFIHLIMKKKDKLITVCGDEKEESQMCFYRNPEFKEAIRESEFVQIGKCSILEKVNVVGLLGLSKVQSSFIDDSVIGEQSVLITKYSDYMVKEKEFEEDEEK